MRPCCAAMVETFVGIRLRPLAVTLAQYGRAPARYESRWQRIMPVVAATASSAQRRARAMSPQAKRGISRPRSALAFSTAAFVLPRRAVSLRCQRRRGIACGQLGQDDQSSVAVLQEKAEFGAGFERRRRPPSELRRCHRETPAQSRRAMRPETLGHDIVCGARPRSISVSRIGAPPWPVSPRHKCAHAMQNAGTAAN